MRLRFSLLLIAVLLISLVPAGPLQSAPLEQQPLPGSFRPAECPIPPVEGLEVDCGYLTVAESRQNFTGKTIDLAVAILRSPSPNPAPDPIFLLTGGPGQAALPLAPVLAQIYAPMIAERDMVLIDQRGTGYSQPLLSCPQTDLNIGETLQIQLTEDQQRPVFVQQQYQRLIDCGRQLQAQGIDLQAYNSVESAADLEDLRIALGYEQINLFGVSYGSRLALTAMRYRPETLRSVVIGSPVPLQTTFQVEAFDSFNNALSRFFAACAEDPVCSAAYPNLEERFTATVERLNQDAAQVPIINPQSGELIDYLPFTGVDLTLLLFQLFYSTTAIPRLPAVIDATANENYRPLGSILSAFILQPGAAEQRFGEGMQVAVQCNEDVTFAEPLDFVALRDSNRRVSGLAFQIIFNEAYLDVCRALGLEQPFPAFDAPVVGDVPTLIMAGEYDPVTPPTFAREAAETLSNSSIAVLPRGGHSPSGSSPCLVSIASRFLASPVQTPDRSCLAAEGPIPFFVP